MVATELSVTKGPKTSVRRTYTTLKEGDPGFRRVSLGNQGPEVRTTDPLVLSSEWKESDRRLQFEPEDTSVLLIVPPVFLPVSP